MPWEKIREIENKHKILENKLKEFQKKPVLEEGPLNAHMEEVTKEFENKLEEKLTDEQREPLKGAVLGALMQVANKHPIENALTLLESLQ